MGNNAYGQLGNSINNNNLPIIVPHLIVAAEKLGRLEQAARGTENLLTPILDAADSYATVGEIAGTLKTVFGEYREAR